MADQDTLKALSDENRLRIVELLASGERCVCELATELDASDALVSHHLKALRESGLVRTRRIGRWLHCSLEPSAFEALAGRFQAIARAARDAQGTSTCCKLPVDPGEPAADGSSTEYPTVKEEIWP